MCYYTPIGYDDTWIPKSKLALTNVAKLDYLVLDKIQGQIC